MSLDQIQSSPHFTFKACPDDPSSPDPVGVIVCKQSMHRERANRGYIAMLSVRKDWRKRGIGEHSVPLRCSMSGTAQADDSV